MYHTGVLNPEILINPEFYHPCINGQVFFLKERNQIAKKRHMPVCFGVSQFCFYSNFDFKDPLSK